MSDRELRVRKIRNGTVIDHIPKGRSLIVLRILGITGEEDYIIALVMNVESKKLGKKDIVKIENRELTEDEVNLIALVAPTATINIIRDYKVVKKYNVRLPERISGILRCANPTCITNSGEPVKPVFDVISCEPLKLRCTYCWTYITYNDITRQFEEKK